jgi:hypothetical protein
MQLTGRIATLGVSSVRVYWYSGRAAGLAERAGAKQLAKRRRLLATLGIDGCLQICLAACPSPSMQLKKCPISDVNVYGGVNSRVTVAPLRCGRCMIIVIESKSKLCIRSEFHLSISCTFLSHTSTRVPNKSITSQKFPSNRSHAYLRPQSYQVCLLRSLHPSQQFSAVPEAGG